MWSPWTGANCTNSHSARTKTLCTSAMSTPRPAAAPYANTPFRASLSDNVVGQMAYWGPGGGGAQLATVAVVPESGKSTAEYATSADREISPRPTANPTNP